jgi:tRNA pseudouridine38-40 synthase
MQNWRLTLSYDGTDFAGWQVQPGLPTIQGELQQALGRITGESPLPQGSGRTDAGVHALAQVASFQLAAPIPPQNLERALNRTLPSAIRVLNVAHAGEDFHARHSARGKTYEYRIFTGALCSPFESRYCWPTFWTLNPEKMQQAAALVLGEHDFTSFAATDPDLTQRNLDEEECVQNPNRCINLSEWQQTEPDRLIYRVHGSGFLHHMVRNLVGTFIEVGRGYFEPESISQILAAKSRKAAGPTAPASGLFLKQVDYEDGVLPSATIC